MSIDPTAVPLGDGGLIFHDIPPPVPQGDPLTDPGPLCLVCGLPAREWHGVGACKCGCVWYTPPDIIGVIDPACGSGAFLVGNPPWAGGAA